MPRKLQGRRGTYTLEAFIGRGGFGEVYRAVSERGERVVVKLFVNTELMDELLRERMRMEYVKVQNLSHPNIVRVLDVLEGERMGYVMEYLPEDLLDRLAKSSVQERVDLLGRVLEGLAFLHDHDIAHRDIKPENIRLRSDGTPVILDFGLAFWGSKVSLTIHHLGTLDPQFGGTILYIPPEVLLMGGDRFPPFARSKVCQKASARLKGIDGVLQRKLHDVYSFGVLAVISLVGGKSKREIVDRILHLYTRLTKDPDRFFTRDFPDMLDVVARMDGIPAPVRESVHQAVTPYPDERIPTASRLLVLWKQGAGGEEEATTRRVREGAYVWCEQCQRSYTVPQDLAADQVRFCPGCKSPAQHHVVVDKGVPDARILPPEGSQSVSRGDGVVEFFLPVAAPPQEISVGRSKTNRWVIPFPTVSREHCTLILDARGLTVREHRPRNPTHVNDEPLKPGQSVRLSFHGVIAIGGRTYVLYDRVFRKG